MHIGLMMECDFREGRPQREAFDEALATAEAAEALGFDGVWLAERHFAAPGGVAPVSSIGSAPLLLATAIATRTSRLRVGTAVLLLPLGHPVRLAIVEYEIALKAAKFLVIAPWHGRRDGQSQKHP